MKIDKIFFKKYQRQILWLANTWIGKYVFQFEKIGHELRKERIDRITPNSIRYKNKDNTYTEQFFGRNEYALKLAPLVWWLPIELFEEGLDGGKALLRPAYQLALLALFLKLPRGLPLLGLTTTDFYPDAGTGNTTVDGYVNRTYTTGQTFATLRTGAGTGEQDTYAIGYVYLQSHTDTDRYRQMHRFVMLFDTSAIPDTDVISSATISLYGTGKANALGDMDIHICTSDPASDNILIAADYNIANWGTTSFGSDTYAGWDTAGYNVITLSGDGESAISKTGITKLGARGSWDILNSTTGLTWADTVVSNLEFHTSDYGSLKPKLTVTYAPPTTDVPVSEQALVLSLPSPTINFDYLLPLSELGLVFTQEAPSIVLGNSFLATALQLELEQQNPTANYDYKLALSELKLVLDEKDPTIIGNANIPLSELGLEFTQLSPDIAWDSCAEPSELRLVVSLNTPLLRYWARQTKHTASWTNSSKSSAPSWTNLTKHTQ